MSSIISSNTPKKRIAFIDAMRGFTMLLVVYNHIQLTGYHLFPSDFDTYNSLFVKFRMPLFFFISGWVLYKSSRIWDMKTSLSFLRKKFKVQILSTILFFALFVFLFHLNLHESIGTFKAGYWFTYTLFFYFIFYVFSVGLSKWLKNKTKEDFLVVFIAIIVLLAYYYAIMDHQQQHMRIYEVVGVFQWRYYIFFCFGTLVKKYYQSFVKMTDKSWTMAAIVSSFFLLYLFRAFIPPSIDTLVYFLYGFLGIVIVFTAFRKSEKWFSEGHRISRWMQYVGRHTLDIYLLHYFFLPRNLQMVGDFFKTHPNPTLELFVSMALALMVMAACLLTSKVLCTSPWLGEFLFGKKN